MAKTLLTSALKVVDKLTGLVSDNGIENAIKIIEDNKLRDIAYSGGNIFTLIRPTLIEPLILVSKTLKHNDAIGDIIKLNTQMFASFYTQAFHYLTTIYQVDVSTTIDLLSSSYGNPGNGVTFEDDTPALVLKDHASMRSSIKYRDTKGGYSEKDYSFFMNFVINLNMVNKDGVSYKVDIPISVKASIVYVDQKDIEGLVSIKSSEKSFWSRTVDLMTNIIGIGDYIFASDLIDEARERMLKDRKGLIKFMSTRDKQSLSKAASSGALGYGKLYQMLIMPIEELERIETKTGLDIEKDKHKDELLEQMSSMALTSVDTTYETIAVYLNGLSGSTESTFKSLKKGKDSDATELFKQFLSGRML